MVFPKTEMVLVVLGGLSLAASGVEAASILIDDFDTGEGRVEFTSSANNPGPDSFVAPSAIGGYRTLEIIGFPTDSDQLALGTVLEVKMSNEGQSQGTFSSGGRTRTTWDANGAGLGGIDLTDGGVEDTFNFDIVFIDQGTLTLKFNIVSDTFGVASFETSSMIAGMFAAPYSDFTGDSSVFTSVDEINLEITTDPQQDIRIDNILTSAGPMIVVPVPAAAWSGLALLGAVGLAAKLRQAGGE